MNRLEIKEANEMAADKYVTEFITALKRAADRGQLRIHTTGLNKWEIEVIDPNAVQSNGEPPKPPVKVGDVIQMRARSGEWLDFAAIKDSDEVYWANKMLQGTHPQFTGACRLLRQGKVIAQQEAK